MAEDKTIEDKIEIETIVAVLRFLDQRLHSGNPRLS
jgi:hypothetical protein